MQQDGTIATYQQFWLAYLRTHRAPASRRLHYVGSLLALGSVGLALLGGWLWLLAAPVIFYAFAGIGHYFIGGNRPATFGHPLWSLISGYRMLGLALTGRLQPHLDAAEARTHKNIQGFTQNP